MPTKLRYLMEKLGPKHHGATLENFNPPTPTAARVLAAVKDYAKNLQEHIKKGTNILIFGPPGTGKDHLLTALAKLCAANGTYVTLIRGSDLLREASETPERIDTFKKTRILYIQDPLPPIGGLTPTQSSILFEIVDYRWQRNLPIWCSLNVTGSEEAENRLGAATIDRLSDGALVLQTNWPSYRKPNKIITQKQ